MLLAQADRRLGLADRLARVIPDGRDPERVTHLRPDILRARILAIACGYEDADDLDRLRFDPAFKLACGRLPDTGTDLCSQPTVSRWENAPGLRDLVRLMRVMIDLYCASYAAPPAAVTLDIDDTVDVVHGHQQLSLFKAHYDERCFLPIHLYDTATSRPSLCCCVPARPPRASRSAVTCAVSSVASAGIGHILGSPFAATAMEPAPAKAGGRPEVMEWCEKNAVDFIFGLPGNAGLDRLVDETADEIRTRRALDQKPCLRGFAETKIPLHNQLPDLRVQLLDLPLQVWAADITYIPIGRGFLYLVAVIDWASRAVLTWRLSNTMDVSFCVSALEEALARFGKPTIFNTDQGSQFTSAAFTGTLTAAEIGISMDGRSRWMDNVFIERLWRSLKYEDVYLKGYADGHEAKARIAAWIAFYNLRRPHQALGNRMPMAVWRDGVADPLASPAVDMTLRLDNADALPTYPQPQQPQVLVVTS